jgi:hypothetical protein
MSRAGVPARPPTVPVYVQPREEGDATGGVIPYKNVPALFAYYCGVFSVIPFFPIGIAGLILGIIGFRNYRRKPIIKGAVHAWIGILVGGLFGLLWLVLTLMIVVLAVSSA